MPAPKTEEISVDLSAMNHTELVLLARWMGMKATRAIPRDVLVSAIAEFKTIDFRNPIDSYRKTLSTWLTRHWKLVQMQMEKEVCPHCDQCCDMRALDCFLINKSNFRVDDSD